MKRLFGFGCSFTNYRWSTWFDCLAPEFEWAENWGQSGAGNSYIFNSIVEANQRYNFSNNDTVIVCWSTTLRDDRYVGGRWHTLGSTVTCPIYNPEYLKTHIDARGYAIRDMGYITAAQHLLTNTNWTFMSVDTFDLDPDVVEVYSTTLSNMHTSYRESLFKDQWPDHNGDPHPSPEEHLKYIDLILPGWVTKPETRAKMYNESINLNKDPKRSGMAKVTRL